MTVTMTRELEDALAYLSDIKAKKRSAEYQLDAVKSYYSVPLLRDEMPNLPQIMHKIGAKIEKYQQLEHLVTSDAREMVSQHVNELYSFLNEDSDTPHESSIVRAISAGDVNPEDCDGVYNSIVKDIIASIIDEYSEK